MKPLHVGLLVVGAALAGGLAVKMTQPPVLPAPVLASLKASPALMPKRPPTVADRDQTPRASNAVPAVAQANDPADVPATPAPPPVYRDLRPQNQRHTEQTAAPRSPFVQSRRPVEKKPVQMAEADPVAILSPAPYEQPPQAAPSEPPSAGVPAPALPPEQPEPDPTPLTPPRQVTLRPGMPLSVRLNQTLSTEHVVNGDTFQASLAEPIVADGLVVAEKGARVSGLVTDSRKSGRLSGAALLELRLTTVYTADGQRVAVSTEPWIRRADSAARGDAEKIGGGAALGAIVGAIAGGGQGAAIGAGLGGAVGAGAAAATGSKPVSVPSETVIRFRLASKVTITEQQL